MNLSLFTVLACVIVIQFIYITYVCDALTHISQSLAEIAGKDDDEA